MYPSGGMGGRGVDVDLPLAFQAERMPQSAKKITEHRSGAVAAATNTNGNPKSVYFCSCRCRCCCCLFLGSAALCCILQIQFKYKVSSLFFVFSPLSLDRQSDQQTASIWFKSLMWLLWWWWRLSLSLTHSLCLCSCCLWPCGKILKARAKCVNVWEEKFRWQVVTLPRLAVLN